MIASALAAYEAYSVGKKWLPYAIGGAGGLLIGVALAVAGWVWQSKEITSLTTVNAALEYSIENPHDGFKKRIGDLAATIVARDASIHRLNQRILQLASAWSDSRRQAMEAEAETRRRSGAYETYIAKLKEESHDPNADAVDLAGRTFERLQCIRDARAAGTPAGGC